MASETTLRCAFTGIGGKKIYLSWEDADETASVAQIKSLMQAIVANKDIFQDPPQANLGAEFITREVTPVNIS